MMRAELLRRYDMTENDYEDTRAAQHYVCGICKKPESIPNRSLAIDHDHVTGWVRGLLCTRCNQVLGRIEDSLEWLRNAAIYLRYGIHYSDCCPACQQIGKHRLTEMTVGRPAEDGGMIAHYACGCGHQWTTWWAMFKDKNHG